MKDRAPLEALLDELLAVRGATVAAVVDEAGDLLLGRSHDPGVMQGAADLMTSALAAATALGELLPPPAEGGGAARSQVMLDLDSGPILFVPLAATGKVVVMAVSGAEDLGRARHAVRSRLARLEKLTWG